MSTETMIKSTVRERYGQAALRVATGATVLLLRRLAAAARPTTPSPPTSTAQAETAMLPAEAVLASLGCGNPTALAELHAGEMVLDLGSGGGIDVLLSARRVGPTGKAYGLDMTDEMLALARENQREGGRRRTSSSSRATSRAIPLPDDSVDVIISNCVINLSADKRRVLRRGVPRAQAGRPLRRVRRRGAGRGARRGARAAWSSGSAAWPAR